MIFVSLGTQDKPFTRLLEYLENANIDEEVIVQAGYTKFQSSKLKIFEYIGPDEFKMYLDKASVVITHGGVGTIMQALKAQKPVIACPRLAKYGEHQNDHQLQIINNFAKQGYLLALNEDDVLNDVISKAQSFKPQEFKTNLPNFLAKFENYLESL